MIHRCNCVMKQLIYLLISSVNPDGRTNPFANTYFPNKSCRGVCIFYVWRFRHWFLILVSRQFGCHGPLARYVKSQDVHGPGKRECFLGHTLQRKPIVSDPDMQHGTCIMSGMLTRRGEENVSDIPSACATHNFVYLVRGPWCGTSTLRYTQLDHAIQWSVQS